MRGNCQQFGNPISLFLLATAFRLRNGRSLTGLLASTYDH
jgi:hypothetical protein